MATIGERLEEARKRQGISIREAAEATKVRSDFLLRYESNKFDIDLPEVYRKGFLKLYARYLKLDEEQIAREYTNLVQSLAKGQRRGDARSEFLGRMDLPGSHPTLGSTEAEPPGNKPSRGQSRGGPADPVTSSGPEINKAALVGAIAAIILSIALFVIVGIRVFGGGDEPPAAQDASTSAGVIRLEATGAIRKVFVREVQSNVILFDGPMSVGSVPVELEHTGPVRVATSHQQFLKVTFGDRLIQFQGTGPGQRVLGGD